MHGSQTLAFLCKAACVFVGAVHRFKLWDSVSGKLGGKGKCINAQGDSMPAFLICCIISWVNWRGPYFTLQAYRDRAVSNVDKLSQSQPLWIFLVSPLWFWKLTVASTLPDGEDCRLADILPGLPLV